LLFKLPSNLHFAAFAANVVNHFSVPVLSQTGGKPAFAASEKLKSPRLLLFRPLVPTPILKQAKAEYASTNSSNMSSTSLTVHR
jgi:hypothetical protein